MTAAQQVKQYLEKHPLATAHEVARALPTVKSLNTAKLFVGAWKSGSL